jgi:hypothetical protein
MTTACSRTHPRYGKRVTKQLRRPTAARDERRRPKRWRASCASLFPQPGQQLSRCDQNEQQQLKDLAKQQQKLGEKGQQLKQQMQQLGEKAPLFDDEARGQMDQASQRMQSAGDRLQGAKIPARATATSRARSRRCRTCSRHGAGPATERAAAKGKGLPMPMRKRGSRGGSKDQKKVEIPEEDPNANPREFRKDVMDAMKQGAPDRYKEQNKKYYEELVK